MKLTGAQLKEATEALAALATNPDTPALTGLRVRKMRRALEGPRADLDAELEKVLERHVDKDERGTWKHRRVGPNRVAYLARSPEDEVALQAEWKALLAAEHEMECPTLTPKHFEVSPGQKPPQVSAELLEALGPLLEDEDPPQ